MRDIFDFTGQIFASRNLTNGEYKAISSLKNNHKIVIKPADKGSNVVILNKRDYTQEGLRQLNDGQFYEKQAKDLTDHHYKLVKIEADRLFTNKEITMTTYKYITEECQRTPLFYMLPKIHKQLLSPPGRPIVASINSPTEKISHLVDTIIGPLVCKIRSYLKDTRDFLKFIKSLPPLPENCWLVTLDVSALYTNIPHDEGRKAVMKALVKYRKPSDNPSNNSILRLLDLVLTCNNFDFGNNHYLQKSGTAMGTRLAPNYANLFMADFEESHVYNYKKPPLWWKRFIDDIFCIFQGTEDELHEFINHLNTCHKKKTIKFTCDYSKSQVNFLDTTVYRDNKTLKTTLYVKPTDSHSYLAYDSCHPKHMIDGIPYSQFLRVRRICTDWEEFFKHSIRLFMHFSLRGYPNEILMPALQKVSTMSQEEASADTHPTGSPNTKKTLYCITTYNPQDPPIKDIIQKHWPILGRSNATRALLDCNIIYGFRRPKNLRDELVKAKLTPPKPLSVIRGKQDRTTLCNRPNNCAHCPKLNRSGILVSHSNERIYRTKQNISCQTDNVIYCLTCNVPKCGVQYVGQTKNRIMDRFNGHLSDIRHADKSDTTVARHMATHNIKNNPPITISILEFINAPPDSDTAQKLRNKWEKMWMARLNTYIPQGLNIQD